MNTQPEALRQADWLDQWELSKFAATVLRTQHADIERKDALLRQALRALETCDGDGETWGRRWYEDKEIDNAIATITKELAK